MTIPDVVAIEAAWSGRILISRVPFPVVTVKVLVVLSKLRGNLLVADTLPLSISSLSSLILNSFSFASGVSDGSGFSDSLGSGVSEGSGVSFDESLLLASTVELSSLAITVFWKLKIFLWVLA